MSRQACALSVPSNVIFLVFLLKNIINCSFVASKQAEAVRNLVLRVFTHNQHSCGSFSWISLTENRVACIKLWNFAIVAEESVVVVVMAVLRPVCLPYCLHCCQYACLMTRFGQNLANLMLPLNYLQIVIVIGWPIELPALRKQFNLSAACCCCNFFFAQPAQNSFIDCNNWFVVAAYLCCNEILSHAMLKNCFEPFCMTFAINTRCKAKL